MKTILNVRVVRTAALTCVLLAAASAQAAEIKLVTSGAFQAACVELAPDYERATHNKLTLGFGPSMGTTHDAVPMRLERGETIDVVIMAAPAMDGLIKQGKIRPDSRVDLIVSKIGMAVRAGAPKPDISTLAAFKQTLLSAKSIAYSDSASGVYLQNELFPKLGIVEQLKGKATMIPALPVGGIVAKGEAEIGFQQLSELMPVKGIDIVGALPEGAQQVTVFAAGIPTTATQPEAAKALIAWLASPAAYAAMRKSGVEPAVSDGSADVVGAEKALEEAIVRGDVAYVENASTPDLSFTHGDAWITGGQPMAFDDKKSFLERVKDKQWALRELDHVKVEMHGNIGITYGHYVAQNRAGNADQKWLSVWFERVYAKQGGRWLLASHRTVHGPIYGRDRQSINDK